ncbi:TetR/AcrR family transcriptional regulator [Streptomyces lancefieldiae]|uniref:TetR/AcrR family transcriptional regulator n=1 Tax=Streptomyces lancefieldiae TaxID=3075520 RepID=A0ABU3B1N9_9ACTN|nr:TetR/AcrR family transcriptional regulator [Streptomyces sp. DSM 40712]MDT0616371.1 TetR/AcrR family transcriptional regulator [Streptomyces sp. DSM 40712]
MKPLDVLWGGERPRPARGPRPGLSVDKIAAAAIRIADEEGLDALSMHHVAGKLGYTAMSLYRYVPSKEQLVDVVYDRALGPPPTAGRTGQPATDDPDGSDGSGAARDWRAEVRGWVRSMLTVYQQHPWLLDITTSSPPLGPNQLAWLEALLQAFAGIGLTDEEMLHLVMFVTGAVRDLAHTSSEMAQAPEKTGVSMEQIGEGYADAMRHLADSARFPMLARLVGSGTFEPNETPYNDTVPSLDFGLELLLDGVEEHVRRRLRG